MERNEINAILNGMCERCLIKGMIPTLKEAKILCDTFDRFRNINYSNDENGVLFDKEKTLFIEL